MQVSPDETNILVPQRHRSTFLEQMRITNDQINDVNMFDKLVYSLKILKHILPTALGLLDEISDILYGIYADFSSDSIMYAFYAAMLFSPILQMVVWISFFAKDGMNTTYESETYTNLMKSFQLHYVKKFKTHTCPTKAYVYLILAKLYTIMSFIWHGLLNLWKAVLYTIGSELKILPIYLSYHYHKELKYIVTEELVQQFENKKYQIKRQEVTSQRNEFIKKLNQEIEEYNKTKKFESEKKKFRRENPEVKLAATDYMTRAAIVSEDKDSLKSYLENAIINRFLLIGDLIEAVFESLPQLTIQYINNSQISEGWNTLTIFSFVLSIIMVTISSADMINALAKNQTFPLIELINLIHKRNLTTDQNWLLGIHKQDELEIQSVEELEVVAKASKQFFDNCQLVSINLASDPGFINNAICGQELVFLYIKSILIKCRGYNTMVNLDFSDNDAITEQGFDVILDGLHLSEIKSLHLNLRASETTTLLINQAATLIQCLPKQIQELDLSLYRWNITDLSDFGNAFRRLTHMQYLILNLAECQMEDIDNFGDSLKFMLHLKQLSLNIGGSNVQQIKSLMESLSQIQIQQLTLNLTATQIDFIKFSSQLQNLTSVTDLTLALGYQYTIFSSLKIKDTTIFTQSLCKLTKLQKLTINVGQSNPGCNIQQLEIGLKQLNNQVLVELLY